MSLRTLAMDLGPLRDNPAFRRLWLGSGLSILGGQVAVVAVLHQVWVLTHSSVWVGAVGVATAVPMVAFGLVGGALADTVDRRRLAMATTLGQLVTAGLLAAQAIAGVDAVWLVLVLVAGQSACVALGAPARRTFVVRLLPRDQVAAGVALNHLAFQLSLLAGPAVGGIVAGRWGSGVCYAIDAVSFAAALAGVAGLPVLRPDGAPARTGISAIRDGWRFVRRTPIVRGAFLVDAVATVTAMPVSVFPAINQQRYGGDAATLGLFLTAIAVGGVAAGACSGALAEARLGTVMLTAAAGWGLGIVALGAAPTLWLALACLVFAGACDTVSVICRGTIVSTGTPDSYRGRVGAAEHIVGVAGPELGNVRGGLLAGATSPAVALVSGGALCVLGVAAVATSHRELRGGVSGRGGRTRPPRRR